MSKTVVVRYRVRPEAADENARLVEEVYSALAELEPSDFQYVTYRLGDGVSFVHIAHHGEGNPLASLPAFAEFQRDLPLYGSTAGWVERALTSFARMPPQRGGRATMPHAAE